MSTTYSKRQKMSKTKTSTSRISKTENILRIPFLTCFLLQFSSALCVLKFFGLHQRVSPSFVSTFCNKRDVKNPKGSPFYIFRHCDTVEKSQFLIFFRKFFRKGLDDRDNEEVEIFSVLILKEDAAL